MRIRERRAPVAVDPAVRSYKHEPATAESLLADEDRGHAALGKADDGRDHGAHTAIRSNAAPSGVAG